LGAKVVGKCRLRINRVIDNYGSYGTLIIKRCRLYNFKTSLTSESPIDHVDGHTQTYIIVTRSWFLNRMINICATCRGGGFWMLQISSLGNRGLSLSVTATFGFRPCRYIQIACVVLRESHIISQISVSLRLRAYITIRI